MRTRSNYSIGYCPFYRHDADSGTSIPSGQNCKKNWGGAASCFFLRFRSSFHVTRKPCKFRELREVHFNLASKLNLLEFHSKPRNVREINTISSQGKNCCKNAENLPRGSIASFPALLQCAQRYGIGLNQPPAEKL